VIVRVAVVPHPPLLVPEIAAGAAAETVRLRDACLIAARALAQRCGHWVAVAAVELTAASRTAGSFAGYGVDVQVVLDPKADLVDGAELPLPLLIAGWLREQVGEAHITVSVSPVPPGSSTAQCRRIGVELAARLRRDGGPVGLLVLGDGAATHTLRAPGYLDRRAHLLDATVAAALRAADTSALLDLDAGLASELLVAGREAWQVAAAAAQSLAPAYRGELLYSAAPYGVAYHVALWDAAPLEHP
jgi:aromatic ring-opening dioxygenase LigB subunit